MVHTRGTGIMGRGGGGAPVISVDEMQIDMDIDEGRVRGAGSDIENYSIFLSSSISPFNIFFLLPYFAQYIVGAFFVISPIVTQLLRACTSRECLLKFFHIRFGPINLLLLASVIIDS